MLEEVLFADLSASRPPPLEGREALLTHGHGTLHAPPNYRRASGRDDSLASVPRRDTEALFLDRTVLRFRAIEPVARRKLLYLHAAKRLEDLRVPPGNHLEALKGNRAGQHSIRVNDRFRVCFRWTSGGAADVEIVDYH